MQTLDDDEDSENGITITQNTRNSITNAGNYPVSYNENNVSLKDEELDVIGELISNMYGAVEVNKMIQDGIPKKEALNSFMKRVMGSIDK